MTDVKEMQSKIRDLNAEEQEILDTVTDLKRERSELNQIRLSRGKLNKTQLSRVSEIKHEMFELGQDHQDLLRERGELRKTVRTDADIFAKAARELLTGTQYDALMTRIRELTEAEEAK